MIGRNLAKLLYCKFLSAVAAKTRGYNMPGKIWLRLTCMGIILTFICCAAKLPYLKVDKPYFDKESQHLILLPISVTNKWEPISDTSETNQIVTSCLKDCWDEEIYASLSASLSGDVALISVSTEECDTGAFSRKVKTEGLRPAAKYMAGKSDASIVVMGLCRENVTAISDEFSSELRANWHGVTRVVGPSEIGPKLAKSCILNCLTALFLPVYAPTADVSETQEIPVISVFMQLYDRTGLLIWESRGGYDVLQKKVGDYFFTVELAGLFSCKEKQIERGECIEACLKPFVEEIKSGS